MMVFGKKKVESATEKKARLEKELDELNETFKKIDPTREDVAEPETMVQEMKNEKNGNAEVSETFIESTMSRYEHAFPELGPSGHAHVLRTLLVAILSELKELREALKK